MVTALITALQTDGTVKTFQGTYTVNRGVITLFNVQRVGRAWPVLRTYRDVVAEQYKPAGRMLCTAPECRTAARAVAER